MEKIKTAVIDLAGICDNNAESAREKSELFGVPVMTMEEIKADPEIRLAVNRAHALNSEIFRFIRNPGGGFVSESKEHAARMLRAGEFGRSWKTADDNLYAGSLLFENGAVGTLHFDGESIDEEPDDAAEYLALRAEEQAGEQTQEQTAEQMKDDRSRHSLYLFYDTDKKGAGPFWSGSVSVFRRSCFPFPVSVL